MNLLPVITSLWLGILTSISPCPLATNIAAISFLSKKTNSTAKTVISGLLYALGRIAIYTAIVYFIATSIISSSVISNFLQKYMNLFLGPVLIITGVFIAGLIEINFQNINTSEKLKEHASKFGLIGSFLVGVLFALSFCPASAVIFFGSLIPVALKSDVPVFSSAIYGLGTGLPVILFALIIALGATKLSDAYQKTAIFESISRLITGILFIIVGFYYTFAMIYGINFWR